MKERIKSAPEPPAKDTERPRNRRAGASRIMRQKRESNYVPLSFAQQRLWFIHQLDPLSPAYNALSTLHLNEALNIVALEQALNEMVRRHEVLRTTFVTINGEPFQYISDEHQVNLQIVDLSELSPETRKVEARRLAHEEARQPFDLSRDPILRARLLRLGDREWVILFTVHHIACDGWSSKILVEELVKLYQAFASGQPSPLAELPIQYSDYALWQRDWLTGAISETQLSYWKKQLDGIEPLQMPTDRPRPATPGLRGGTQFLLLPKQLCDDLKELARKQKVSLFMVLLAAFKLLLHKYTSQTDISVGTPIAGRNRMEIEGLIGFFVNTLVLRTQVCGALSFMELVDRVKVVALEAYSNQDLPFDKVVDELQVTRSSSYTPLFQVAFNYVNLVTGEGVQLSGLSDEGSEEVERTSKFDLTFALADSGQTISLSVHYNADLFDRSTIKLMLSHFKTLLESAVANPELPISKLRLMSISEREQMLELSQHRRTYAADLQCIYQLFEAQVRLRQSSVAVVYEKEELTYDELNRSATQLAHYLVSLGVGPESRVAICLDRSIHLVVAIIGILKAGAAYVPLDPQYPAERLAFMLEDSCSSVLLTQGQYKSLFAGDKSKMICIDDDWQIIAQNSQEPLGQHLSPDAAAYIIYTSGSTGQPKGVVVTHRNVVRLFGATDNDYGFNEADVWSLFHSYAFDFSVWELWGALIYGGRLVIVPYWVSRSPEAFHELLCEERVTVLNQTPSAFRQLIRADEHVGADKQLALRLVIFGGEALEFASLKTWIERHRQQPQLVNMYGITETTVHVTYRLITSGDVKSLTGSLIGRALPDLDLYILDEQLEPLPFGIAGEIHVGGSGVARGYHRRPELTAMRFIPNPFSDQLGARLYKSGDLGRYLANGDIEYLGRIDAQVKIRGHRIELGEIEATLSKHPLVSEAVVVLSDDDEADKRLVAYVTSRQERKLLASELREFIKDKLPDYMRPAAFVILKQLPLTSNGKVNRRALPAPDSQRPDIDQEFVLPRFDLERFLVEKWKQVLKIDRVGINDNFFELGGDSLKAAVLANRLKEAFGEIIHVVTIFDAPSIAEFANLLNRQYPLAVSRWLNEGGAKGSKKSSASTGEFRQVDASKLAHLRQLIQPLPPANHSVEAQQGKNQPAIFILSPPRSGSTLLRVMLSGHPRLFAPPELELLSFYTLEERSKAFSGRDHFWREGVVRAVMELRSCEGLQAIEIIEDCEKQRLTTRQFYGLLQSWLVDKLLVDKTPSYALDINVLKRAEEEFEGAFYIHLLRSPQAMIRSFEEAKLDQIFPRFKHPFPTREVAELIWIVSQQNILQFLAEVPPERQYQVRFEDLVTEPSTVLQGICHFLGIDFHPDMMEPYKDKRKRMTDGVHAVSHMLGDIKFHTHTSINPRTADGWRDYYKEDFLSALTWELAELLGYKREEFAASSASYMAGAVSPIRPIQDSAGEIEIQTQLARISEGEMDLLLKELTKGAPKNR